MTTGSMCCASIMRTRIRRTASAAAYAGAHCCALSPCGLRHAHISGRRAYGARCEGARHMVPSPLVGEGQGEGWPQSTEDEAPPDWRTVNGCRAGLIGSWIRTKSSAAIPLSLSLPHKGGGNVVALLCPFPRNAPAYGSEMCACLSPLRERATLADQQALIG
jgi:hypothetical protein